MKNEKQVFPREEKPACYVKVYSEMKECNDSNEKKVIHI